MAGKAHSARGAAASRRWVPRGGAATGMVVTSTLFIFPKSPHLPARLAALLQGRDAATLPAERPVAEEELRAGLLALPRAGGGGPWPGTALGCAAGCGRCCAPVAGALGSLWVAPAEGGVEPGCQLLPAIGRSAHSASRGHKGSACAESRPQARPGPPRPAHRSFLTGSALAPACFTAAGPGRRTTCCCADFGHHL